jgi:hypothetical protein
MTIVWMRKDKFEYLATDYKKKNLRYKSWLLIQNLLPERINKPILILSIDKIKITYKIIGLNKFHKILYHLTLSQNDNTPKLFVRKT